MKREIFTLLINCYESHEVNCDGTIYRQILFDGSAKGPEFNGRILPGGVDTQIQKSDGSGNLLAKYILEGTDSKGLPCRIFIENTAALGSPDTFPKCFSDSENLKWLKDADLRGRMINDEEGFKIVFSAS